MRMTDAKVFLSSEAAKELDKIPSSDKQRVISVIDMLANTDVYPQVNVLKLRGPGAPVPNTSASVLVSSGPPLARPSWASMAVIIATVTVVMNMARMSPLTARKAAFGSSPRRRAAMSAAARLACWAMSRAPVIVSHGPATMSPAMISKNPGEYAISWLPSPFGCR
jgi:hypothetical protein